MTQSAEGVVPAPEPPAAEAAAAEAPPAEVPVLAEEAPPTAEAAAEATAEGVEAGGVLWDADAPPATPEKPRSGWRFWARRPKASAPADLPPAAVEGVGGEAVLAEAPPAGEAMQPSHVAARPGQGLLARLGERLAAQPPEPWAVEYVLMGRWLALVYHGYLEACYTRGVHPFTGGSLPECEAEPEPEPKGKGKAGDKDGGSPAAPARPSRDLQRCFLDACCSARDQLLRETQGMAIINALLAVAAVTLIGSLGLGLGGGGQAGGWSGTTYASYVLLVLSVAASLTHLAIAGAVAAMGAGRGPRPFVRLVLQCEELARAKLDSFFAALNFLFFGTMVFLFAAAWDARQAGSGGDSGTYTKLLPVLFIALAGLFYIPALLTARWVLRSQERYEAAAGRLVTKASLLALEPLLAWDFASRTNPRAYASQAQVAEFEPLRRYCERRSYDVVRAFERQPLVYWPAWALNHLLSLLGPTSLLRIRPSGPALGPSHPSQDASKGLTVGPHPPPPPPPAALPEGAGSSVESYVAVM